MKGDIDLTRRFIAKLMEPMEPMESMESMGPAGSMGPMENGMPESTSIPVPHPCCELRVWKAQYNRDGYITAAARFPRIFSGWYDDPARLAIDAGRLRGVSGYITANPVTALLLSRSDNCLSPISHATRDQDIVALRWLFIDIDPVLPPDISSTDEELNLVLARRDAILGDHPEIAASGLWGCSGNGAWILARLPDLPVTPRNREFVTRTIKVLAERYTDNVAEIDIKSRNPSRVNPLPGTFKCKGSSRPDRPWRMVTWDNEPADSPKD